MTKIGYENARREARRFLEAGKTFEATHNYKEDDLYSPCKESGSLKRASLDLTRALAEMRK